MCCSRSGVFLILTQYGLTRSVLNKCSLVGAVSRDIRTLLRYGGWGTYPSILVAIKKH